MVCPRRATKEHEELQRQHICPRRTRRAAENCNGDCNFLLSTKGREGPRRKPLPDHNLVCPRRDWGNTFFVHEGPRRNTKNCNGNTFVHGGHGGPRRTATATATSFCPRRAAKGHEGKVIICPQAPTKGRGEHLMWLTQIVVEHENQAKNGLIVPAGVLFCHIVSSLL